MTNPRASSPSLEKPGVRELHDSKKCLEHGGCRYGVMLYDLRTTKLHGLDAREDTMG